MVTESSTLRITVPESSAFQLQASTSKPEKESNPESNPKVKAEQKEIQTDPCKSRCEHLNSEYSEDLQRSRSQMLPSGKRYARKNARRKKNRAVKH